MKAVTPLALCALFSLLVAAPGARAQDTQAGAGGFGDVDGSIVLNQTNFGDEFVNFNVTINVNDTNDADLTITVHSEVPTQSQPGLQQDELILDVPPGGSPGMSGFVTADGFQRFEFSLDPMGGGATTGSVILEGNIHTFFHFDDAQGLGNGNVTSEWFQQSQVFEGELFGGGALVDQRFDTFGFDATINGGVSASANSVLTGQIFDDPFPFTEPSTNVFEANVPVLIQIDNIQTNMTYNWFMGGGASAVWNFSTIGSGDARIEINGTQTFQYTIRSLTDGVEVVLPVGSLPEPALAALLAPALAACALATRRRR